jgi:hypothetical protein
MAPNSNGNVIIGRFHDANAPTGDPGYVQTANGTIWHVVDIPPSQGTGDRQGVIVDGRVIE